MINQQLNFLKQAPTEPAETTEQPTMSQQDLEFFKEMEKIESSLDMNFALEK